MRPLHSDVNCKNQHRTFARGTCKGKQTAGGANGKDASPSAFNAIANDVVRRRLADISKADEDATESDVNRRIGDLAEST